MSITECIKNNSLDFSISSGERIGFVTPVYHWGLPTIVTQFMEKLKFNVRGTPYTYHVLTYGTTTGKAHKMMEKELKYKGLKLDGKFIVRMPDTWTPMFDLSNKDEVNAILRHSETETNAVVQNIKTKLSGDFNNKKNPFGEVLYCHYRNGGKTAKFTVDTSCIGCGLCERQCPSSAIKMKEGKPVWVKERCTQCLGCLHRCPKFAIQFGKNTKKHGQYINPYVSKGK